MGEKKDFLALLLAFGLMFFSALSFVSSAIYFSDVYFTVPESVYTENETISLKGFVYQANYTDAGVLVNASAVLANATVNLSILYSNRTFLKMYNFTTDANGSFYSKSNFRTSSLEVNAPLVAGTYVLQSNYTDLNSNISFSEVKIIVVNTTTDFLRVSTEKAKYSSGDTITINVEAVKLVGDRSLFVSNVSVSGTFK